MGRARKAINHMTVTKEKFEKLCDAYFTAWKIPNKVWKELGKDMGNRRGINLPESFSEIIGAYALEWKLVVGGGGDACRGKHDEIIVEIKSTTIEKDTSSFSPKEKFDELWFVKINTQTDRALIYNIHLDSTSIRSIQLTKTKTFGDQADNGRRPRFSLIKKIIEPKRMKPLFEVDIKRKKVTKL